MLHAGVEGTHVREVGEVPRVSEGGDSRGMDTCPCQTLDLLGLAAESI